MPGVFWGRLTDNQSVGLRFRPGVIVMIYKRLRVLLVVEVLRLML